MVGAVDLGERNWIGEWRGRGIWTAFSMRFWLNSAALQVRSEVITSMSREEGGEGEEGLEGRVTSSGSNLDSAARVVSEAICGKV